MVEASKKTQKAFCLTGSGGQSDVVEIDIPRPQSGQVLIKVECAPLNPSDIYNIKGMYEEWVNDDGGKFFYPFPVGWEGSGTVIASGGGLMAWYLVGKRVAFSKDHSDGVDMRIGGAFQQYCVTGAVSCLVLPKSVSFEKGAMQFVNPLTALGLIETATVRDKSPAIIFTAAASQLGRMVVNLCKQQKIPMICTVRKQEQVDILKNLGAEHIINTSEENWEQELKKLAHKLKAKACLESIGGEMTGKILNLMPRDGVSYFYGAMSMQAASNLDPLQTIFRHKRVEGWNLGTFMDSKGLWDKIGFVKKAQKLLQDDTLKSDVAERISLEEIKDSIPKYEANMTAGKYVIYPNKE